ncbi:hypothetical protein ACVWW5_003048 [Bradyrhizobium sp. LM3.4]
MSDHERQDGQIQHHGHQEGHRIPRGIPQQIGWCFSQRHVSHPAITRHTLATWPIRVPPKYAHRASSQHAECREGAGGRPWANPDRFDCLLRPLPRLAEQIFARAAFAWTDRKRAVQSRKGALRVRRTHHSLASSGARTDEATDRPAGIGWPPPSAGGPAAGVASRPRSARSSVRSAPHSFPDGNLRSAADHPVVACRSSRKLSRQEHCRGSGAPQCQSGIRQSVGPRREVYGIFIRARIDQRGCTLH